MWRVMCSPVQGHAMACPCTGEPSESHNYVLKGYRLVDCTKLSQVVSEIGACVACGYPLTLRENLVTRRELV